MQLLLAVWNEHWHYSVMKSIGATQCFPANHKMSSEQKNLSSFFSDQSQKRVKSDGELWLDEKRWVAPVQLVSL